MPEKSLWPVSKCKYRLVGFFLVCWRFSGGLSALTSLHWKGMENSGLFLLQRNGKETFVCVGRVCKWAQGMSGHLSFPV